MARTSGGSGGGSGTVTSVTAANSTITVAGTATAPTVAASLPVMSNYMATSVGGNGTFAQLCSLALGVGTWLVLGTLAVTSTTAAVGAVYGILGPVSQSNTSAYVQQETTVGNLAGAAEFLVVPLLAAVVLASPTTVYLNWFGAADTTALANDASAHPTGIVAVQIA